MSLEQIIQNEVELVEKKQMRRKPKKVLVYGDTHFPYHNEKAIEILYRFMEDYKPNIVVHAGDIVDFYSISKYDKNPEHFDLQYELDLANRHLFEIRQINKKAEIYLILGNHDYRLEKYVYRHPELKGLEALKIDNLLDVRSNKIKVVRGDPDYWSKYSGYLELGDVIIMHGDSRLNGATTSKYAGYSAKNTMMSLQKSVVMGHVHRLALVYHQRYNQRIFGVEIGCMSKIPPQANWQNGFVTFELYHGKVYNVKLHYIDDGLLVEDEKIYKVK